jgi:hypothetical protein
MNLIFWFISFFRFKVLYVKCRNNKSCTRLAAGSDKVYQLLSHGRWFSPGTLTSSSTKTGRHDITEILLKVALNTIKQTIIFLCINANKYGFSHFYSRNVNEEIVFIISLLYKRPHRDVYEVSVFHETFFLQC